MYVRPLTLDEALESLSRADAVVIGGGTKVNPAATADPVMIVDLQALGLDRVEATADATVGIGATTTLQQLADEPAVPAAIRDAARREAPSAVRTLATVAGCVATADRESELLAALLVHEAAVTLAGRDRTDTVELRRLLADRALLTGRIITSLTIRTGGVSAIARTGRTNADRAIVAAAARRTPGGELRLAVTGVGTAPMPIDVSAGVAAELDGLDPAGDFRGSGEYRRMLAGVLARRALEEVG